MMSWLYGNNSKRGPANTTSQRPTAGLPPRPASTKMSSNFFSSGAASSAANANNTAGELSKDVPLSIGPDDSVSNLAFSPASDHLAVSSWDNKVRIYSIDGNGNTTPAAMLEHQGPALGCCWAKVSKHMRDATRAC